MLNQLEKIVERLNVRLPHLLTSAHDASYWALDSLGIDLYDNQIEIVNAVCDLTEKHLAILQARGAGKTYAVGLGLVKICMDTPGVQIGVFGPKTDQATRIIKEIVTKVLTPLSPSYNAINWRNTTASRLSFVNGSEITAISAGEQTMQEGYHFNIVVLDECHRISDISVNQRIIPMLGSLTIGKIIKLGISMYKQNFWESCSTTTSVYKILKRDWTQCPILLVAQGSVVYTPVPGSLLYKEGQENPPLELSKYVIEQMPLVLKEKFFPDRPDLHYDGSMTEVDFKTQYMMEWADDINLELSREDQEKLASGDFQILSGARRELKEIYFFGLDTAAGTILPGRRNLDHTALSIWRKAGGIKEKVKAYQWQGNILEQLKEIKEIIDPKNGIFPCMFGLVDHSNIAQGFVEHLQKEEGIPVAGIMFGSTEKTSHKNWKNAMFDHFKFEVQSYRCKYPKLDILDRASGKDVLMKKAFNEWCNIERHKKLGINDQIEAPVSEHDDHCCADVLAVWAADKTADFDVAVPGAVQMVFPKVGVQRIMGRGIPTESQNKGKYLPNANSVKKANE
jgi:hypothetical protein